MIKIKGYRILYVEGEFLILYKNFNIFLYRNEKIVKVMNIPSSRAKLLFSQIRLLNRLLRLEPRAIGRLSEGRYVISLCGIVYFLDVNLKKIRVLSESGVGFSTPLNFCSDYDGLYWGDYGANPDYNPVNIYKLDQNLEVSIIYTFNALQLRHIHNIFFDKKMGGFWIFCGDNEAKAGIYFANKEWTNVRPLKIGKQKYRAVVGFACNDGIIYATDSVETDNFIYHINNQGEEKILSPINGSCIYGLENKNYYIFSTVVESHEGGGMLGLFSRKRGSGIKTDDVCLVVVSKDTLEVREVITIKKDFWPMKLFQYGTFLFPGGQEKDEKGIWCYPVACNTNEGSSIYLDI